MDPRPALELLAARGWHPERLFGVASAFQVSERAALHTIRHCTSVKTRQRPHPVDVDVVTLTASKLCGVCYASTLLRCGPVDLVQAAGVLDEATSPLADPVAAATQIDRLRSTVRTFVDSHRSAGAVTFTDRYRGDVPLDVFDPVLADLDELSAALHDRAGAAVAAAQPHDAHATLAALSLTSSTLQSAVDDVVHALSMQAPLFVWSSIRDQLAPDGLQALRAIARATAPDERVERFASALAMSPVTAERLMRLLPTGPGTLMADLAEELAGRLASAPDRVERVMTGFAVEVVWPRMARLIAEALERRCVAAAESLAVAPLAQVALLFDATYASAATVDRAATSEMLLALFPHTAVGSTVAMAVPERLELDQLAHRWHVGVRVPVGAIPSVKQLADVARLANDDASAEEIVDYVSSLPALCPV